MMNKKYNLIILSVLLIGALAATVFLTSQRQETRRGASSANTNLSLLPTENTKRVGDDLAVHLNFDGENKVDNIKTRICYNTSLLQIKGSAVSIVGPVCGWCGTECKTVNFDSDCTGTPAASVFGKVCINTNGTCKVNKVRSTGSIKADDLVKAAVDPLGLFGSYNGSADKVVKLALDPADLTGSSFTGAGNTIAGMALDPAGVFGPFGGKLTGATSYRIYPGYLNQKLLGDQLTVNTNGSINRKYKIVDIAVVPESLKADGVNRCVDITVGSVKKSDNLKTADEAAVIHFQAKKPGEGKIVISKADTNISGDVTGLDKTITVGNVTGLNYKILPKETTPTGTGNVPVLNFRMAFGFARPTSNCANWSVQVTVMNKDGESKTYDNVALTKTADINVKGETVYQGSVKLEGFTNKNNLAVFIKGPKHLRMKYGVNNQTAFYNKAGGEIDGLTDDPATSPVFNFSGYSALPGDVVGGPNDSQDGVIDGRDFAFIKTQTTQRLSVANGQDIKSDLNGDCTTNSSDTIIFTQSLIDKQEQLY